MEVKNRKLGEFEYEYQFREGRSPRAIWKNPPPKGTRLIAMFDAVVVVGLTPAGTVLYINERTGIQSGAYPHDLRVA